MGIARVVIGLDGSAPSAHALQVALQILPENVEFLAVFAYNPSPAALSTPSGVIPLPPAEWRDAIVQEMQSVWCVPLKTSNRQYQTLVADGAPADILFRTAQDFKADLIVIGHHPRGALAELVLGSVSHELLRHAHCPLLFIPPNL